MMLVVVVPLSEKRQQELEHVDEIEIERQRAHHRGLARKLTITRNIIIFILQTLRVPSGEPCENQQAQNVQAKLQRSADQRSHVQQIQQQIQVLAADQRNLEEQNRNLAARQERLSADKNALAADAVLTISRIKPHTDFRGKFESGILKMLVIGLGKREGASQHHRWGFKGLRDMMPETAKVILEKSPFQAGLAILENARERTARLEVIDRSNLFSREPQLLEEARGLMGRLPFPQLDLLVVGEIGKNYSGAGIDPNVVGRLLIETQPEDPNPCITRMCCLDLSPESHGNGTGVGIADLTTDRLLSAIDPVPFRMNNLTACFLWRSKLPLGFPNDKTCIEQGIITSWQPRAEELRVAIIPNTLELETIWVSPKLWEEASAITHLRRHDALTPLPMDPAGNLQQEKLFPESVRGRRQSGGH